MRVLLIRFSSLGDVVLTSAVMRAVHKAHPEAEITLATKAQYAPLFESFKPAIRIAALDRGETWSQFLQRLNGRRFDHVLDMHGSLRARRLCRSVKARRAVRVRKFTWRRFLMVRFKRGLDRPLSTLDNYFTTAVDVVAASDREHPRLFLTAAELEKVVTEREAVPHRAGIGWGARWPTKAVPESIWSAIIERLATAGVGEIRFFGLESDRAAISGFAAAHGDRRTDIRFSIACGLPLREVMTQIASCRAFVSSDSGLMHVAAALDIPTIGLFGPTHPALGFAPVGRNTAVIHAGTECSPCHRHGRKPCFRDRRYCFDEMDIDRIIDVIRRYVGTQKRERT
jgi:heptosyltransferase-2